MANIEENYSLEKNKLDASLRWLMCKAFDDDKIPEIYNTIFYEDGAGGWYLRPQLMRALASGELYCACCTRLFKSQHESWTDHALVLSNLSRRGFEVKDENGVLVTEVTLQRDAPFHTDAHLSLIDAIMGAYTADLLDVRRVLTAVRLFSSTTSERDLDEAKFVQQKDLGLALHYWLEQACRASLRQRFRRNNSSLDEEAGLDRVVQDLWFGTRLALLVNFYSPDLAPYDDIVMSSKTSSSAQLQNVCLVRDFCVKHIAHLLFHLTPSDLANQKVSGTLRANITMMLAELFVVFEQRQGGSDSFSPSLRVYTTGWPGHSGPSPPPPLSFPSAAASATSRLDGVNFAGAVKMDTSAAAALRRYPGGGADDCDAASDVRSNSKPKGTFTKSESALVKKNLVDESAAPYFEALLPAQARTLKERLTQNVGKAQESGESSIFKPRANPQLQPSTAYLESPPEEAYETPSDEQHSDSFVTPGGRVPWLEAPPRRQHSISSGDDQQLERNSPRPSTLAMQGAPTSLKEQFQARLKEHQQQQSSLKKSNQTTWLETVKKSVSTSNIPDLNDRSRRRSHATNYKLKQLPSSSEPQRKMLAENDVNMSTAEKTNMKIQLEISRRQIESKQRDERQKRAARKEEQKDLMFRQALSQQRASSGASTSSTAAAVAVDDVEEINDAESIVISEPPRTQLVSSTSLMTTSASGSHCSSRDGSNSPVPTTNGTIDLETYHSSLDRLNNSLSQLHGEISKLSLQQNEINQSIIKERSASNNFEEDPFPVSHRRTSGTPRALWSNRPPVVDIPNNPLVGAAAPMMPPQNSYFLQQGPGWPLYGAPTQPPLHYAGYPLLTAGHIPTLHSMQLAPSIAPAMVAPAPLPSLQQFDSVNAAIRSDSLIENSAYPVSLPQINGHGQPQLSSARDFKLEEDNAHLRRLPPARLNSPGPPITDAQQQQQSAVSFDINFEEPKRRKAVRSASVSRRNLKEGGGEQSTPINMEAQQVQQVSREAPTKAVAFQVELSSDVKLDIAGGVLSNRNGTTGDAQITEAELERKTERLRKLMEKRELEAAERRARLDAEAEMRNRLASAKESERQRRELTKRAKRESILRAYQERRCLTNTSGDMEESSVVSFVSSNSHTSRSLSVSRSETRTRRGKSAVAVDSTSSRPKSMLISALKDREGVAAARIGSTESLTSLPTTDATSNAARRPYSGSGSGTVRLSTPSMAATASEDSTTTMVGGDNGTSVEYVGPRLFKPPTAKSNRSVIHNALAHCCLAGAVNLPLKDSALKALSEAEDSTMFMIMFRDGGCQYRALYAFDMEAEILARIVGKGPLRVTSDMVNRFFKYNSGGKKFTEIKTTKHLSPAIDAFTIHDIYWKTAAAQQKSNLMATSARAKASAATRS